MRFLISLRYEKMILIYCHFKERNAHCLHLTMAFSPLHKMLVYFLYWFLIITQSSKERKDFVVDGLRVLLPILPIQTFFL